MDYESSFYALNSGLNPKSSYTLLQHQEAYFRKVVGSWDEDPTTDVGTDIAVLEAAGAGSGAAALAAAEGAQNSANAAVSLANAAQLTANTGVANANAAQVDADVALAAIDAVYLAPEPLGVGVNDSTQLQGILNTLPAGSTLMLRSGRTYRCAITLPAGTTLNMNGSTIVPIASTTEVRYIVATAGVGCRIMGGKFSFPSESGALGGERAIDIKHAETKVMNVSFVGGGFRYGIYIESASGGSCDDCVIDGCYTTGTSYGILKQGGNNTTANRLRITNNTFKSITRGDAIELNIGNDYGYFVDGNTIDGVQATGVSNAGIGIGVAGGSPGIGYAASTVDNSQTDLRITNNIVRNCSYQNIHLEVSSRFVVSDNSVTQHGALVRTGTGIVSYGGIDGNISDNFVRGFDTGVREEPGVAASVYVVSARNNTLCGNRIEDCNRALMAGSSGEKVWTLVKNNVAVRCTIGHSVNGHAEFYVDGNVSIDCTTPYHFDMDPAAKSGVKSIYAFLHAHNNKAYFDGYEQPFGNTLNLSTAIIDEKDNNFLIAAAGSTVPTNYHVPGDIANVAGVWSYCTVAGYVGKVATVYYFTAVAGDSHITVVSPGDSATKYVVGQRISLPGAGTAGADLIAYITRIYIPGYYRMNLSTPVVTTVSTSTIIGYAPLATYVAL